MIPIRARSRKLISELVSIASIMARASSLLSTGVLSFFTTSLGPRTAWAELVSRTWPVRAGRTASPPDQMLLHGGGREVALQILDEGVDMERLHVGKLADAMLVAPLGKAPRRIQVGLARVVVVDLRREDSSVRSEALSVSVNSRAGVSGQWEKE